MRLAGVGALAVAMAIVPGVASAGSGKPAPTPAAVVNPDFEDDATGVAAPTGWSEVGQAGASYTEAGGAGGSFRLTHWSASAYQVETLQRVTGLGRGPYTLRASVRTSGDQTAAYLFLRDCGGPQRTITLPRTGPEWWVQIVLSTPVRGGACTIGVHSDGVAGSWLNVDAVSLTPGDAGRVDISGADVSSLKKNEDHGAVYLDAKGRKGDALKILADNGVNYARLKLWVNPADGYSNRTQVLAMAKRAKARGMKLLVDFHYSDSWADPGKQNKPAAWASLPFDELKQAVYDYTYDVLAALRRQHTPADMAQIGNEINGGLLWPDGRWDNWDGMAALLTAGSTAVTAASPHTKVALHLAEGGNNGGHVWWFDNAVSRGVPFDVIAVSHYTYWHGPLGYLQANLLDLVKRYDKDIMVVETAYGFTQEQDDALENIFNPSLQATSGYPATPEGQARALRDMFNVVAAVPGGRGLGVFYWEPAWTAVAGSGWDPADPTSGNAWENQAVFDYSGKALPALKVFGEY
ncbi:glycosyl hydrolase 53 family protein [Luedemannella flava]|uniref:Arabinogalactan endo-beta-1,4-galactanase n=1 Tax=Luedemannella flava TaxID=349316 RepID=A0ABN2LWY0_9ACTN